MKLDKVTFVVHDQDQSRLARIAQQFSVTLTRQMLLGSGGYLVTEAFELTKHALVRSVVIEEEDCHRRLDAEERTVVIDTCVDLLLVLLVIRSGSLNCLKWQLVHRGDR